MSSISSTTTGPLAAQRWSSQVSPQARMADTISSELSAGSLSSSDATALTSALSSIDSSLSVDRTKASGGTQSKLDPSAVKDRIDSLIADQVSSGSLTDDQATELKNLFASHGQSAQAADATAQDGGLLGAGGSPPAPPPGPLPSDAAAGDGASSSTGTSSPDDLLASFLQQVQGSQSASTGYGANGTNTRTNTTALLFDFQG